MASPGVYPTEVDLSLYTSIEASTYFGVVGTFNKGPLDTVTLITSFPELIQNFGTPFSGGTAHAWYACREYLRRGNKLKVVRVDSAATPSVTAKGNVRGYYSNPVPLDGPHADITTAGAGTATSAALFTFRTDNVKPGDILHITAGADTGYWEIGVVNSELVVTCVGITAWPSGGAGAQTAEVISGLRQSLADGATSTPALRTFTSATGRFAHATASNHVQVGDILLINDIAPTDGDNGLYVVESVGATTVVVNRDWPVGSLANLTYQIYTWIASGDDGATAGPANTIVSATTWNNDFVTKGVVAGDMLVVNDAVDTGNNGTYYITNVAATTLTVHKNFPQALTGLTFYVYPSAVKFAAYYTGDYGDDLELYVTANAGAPNTAIDLEVRENGVMVEKWFGTTYTTIATDLAASTYIVPTQIAGRGGIPANHDTDMMGGGNGTAGIVDADYIGVSGTGLQLFASAEAEEVDILAVPSVYSQAVGDALVAIAEARQNCMVLCDTPPWATVDTPTEATQWHNGQGGFGRTTAISSSFACVYWPEVYVYDEYNAAYYYTSPAGFVAAAWANSDKISYKWFAPAGGVRGKIVGAAGTRMVPSQGQRDYMQQGTNAVNPVVNFVGEGIMLYGQKTCLRTTTALNRINTRRMLIWIEQNGAKVLRNFVTDPNDATTWRAVKGVLDPLLRYVKANRGISDYLIVCDASNNTAITMANYQLIVEVFLKPIPAAEEIKVRFVLTAQDANFEELISGAL